MCKLKSHKHCAIKVTLPCKWATLEQVGEHTVADEGGFPLMPHQWLEGNLPVSAKCSVCDRTCGSVLRLQVGIHVICLLLSLGVIMGSPLPRGPRYAASLVRVTGDDLAEPVVLSSHSAKST